MKKRDYTYIPMCKFMSFKKKEKNQMYQINIAWKQWPWESIYLFIHTIMYEYVFSELKK